MPTAPRPGGVKDALFGGQLPRPAASAMEPPIRTQTDEALGFLPSRIKIIYHPGGATCAVGGDTSVQVAAVAAPVHVIVRKRVR